MCKILMHKYRHHLLFLLKNICQELRLNFRFVFNRNRRSIMDGTDLSIPTNSAPDGSMPSTEKIGRKRKHSHDDDDDQQESNRDKVFVHESGTAVAFKKGHISLLNLSDEVLLEILLHCNSVTLDALAQ